MIVPDNRLPRYTRAPPAYDCIVISNCIVLRSQTEVFSVGERRETAGEKDGNSRKYNVDGVTTLAPRFLRLGVHWPVYIKCYILDYLIRAKPGNERGLVNRRLRSSALLRNWSGPGGTMHEESSNTWLCFLSTEFILTQRLCVRVFISSFFFIITF